MRIELSCEEWDAFSRKRALDDDESALPTCCASISNFRDAILAIHKSNGELTDELSARLREAWEDLFTAHGPNEGWSPIFLRFLAQAGLMWPVAKST